MTPAHLAVEHEDLPKLRELLDAGADLEDPDEQGFTLLLHAIDIERDGANQTGEPLHVSMTAFLLARGADPLRRDCLGMTPLDFAETTGHWLAAELIRAWTRRWSQRPGCGWASQDLVERDPPGGEPTFRTGGWSASSPQEAHGWRGSGDRCRELFPLLEQHVPRLPESTF